MIILWVFKKHESFKALHIFCLWGEYFSRATVATGWEREEDGKPQVTSLTIILFAITFRQSSLSFKQIFL